MEETVLYPYIRRCVYNSISAVKYNTDLFSLINYYFTENINIKPTKINDRFKKTYQNLILGTSLEDLDANKYDKDITSLIDFFIGSENIEPPYHNLINLGSGNYELSQNNSMNTLVSSTNEYIGSLRYIHNNNRVLLFKNGYFIYDIDEQIVELGELINYDDKTYINYKTKGNDLCIGTSNESLFLNSVVETLFVIINISHYQLNSTNIHSSYTVSSISNTNNISTISNNVYRINLNGNVLDNNAIIIGDDIYFNTVVVSSLDINEFKITFRVPINTIDDNSMANLKLPFRIQQEFQFPLILRGTFNSNNDDISTINIDAGTFNPEISLKFQDVDGNMESTIAIVSGVFSELSYLTSGVPANNYILSIENFNIHSKRIVNMANLFYNNSIFNGDVNDWDVSNITTMRNMFRNATSFNQSISNWDVSRVANMGDMFNGATSYNNGQPLEQNGYLTLLYNGGMIDRGETQFNNTIRNTIINDATRYVNFVNDTELIKHIGEGSPSFINVDIFYNAIFSPFNVTFRVPSSIVNNNNMANIKLPFNNITSRLTLSGMFNSTLDNYTISSINTNTNNTTVQLKFKSVDNNDYMESTIGVLTGIFQHLGYTNENRPGTNYIVSIKNYNTRNNSITNLSNLFYSNNIFNQNIGNWNVSMVESMEGMFEGASLFNNGSINNDGQHSLWNTSPVDNELDLRPSNKLQNVSNMFRGAIEFNQNIGDWNVSMVESMEGMFEGASLFNNGSINNDGQQSLWNTLLINNEQDRRPTNILKNTSNMFFNAQAFNQNINGWNVSGVTNMSSMFANAGTFDKYIGDWNVSSVNTMENMFNNASNFNQSISNWDVASVTNMSSMLKNASLFNNGLSNDMNGYIALLYNNSNNNDGLTIFNNTNNTVNTYLDFALNTKLIDNINEGDLKFNDADAYYNALFVEIEVFSITYKTDYITPQGVIRVILPFYDIEIPLVIEGSFADGGITKIIYNNTSRQYNLNYQNQNNGFYESTVKILRGKFKHFGFPVNMIFENQLNQNSIYSINNHYLINNDITNYSNLFNTNKFFNQDISHWNISNVSNMEYMFFNAEAFNQDIGNWNVSNVSNMQYMFYGAKVFNNGGVGSSLWNTVPQGDDQEDRCPSSKLADTQYMFFNAEVFNQDIGNWNVSNVSNMQYMFSGAISYNNSISKWNISSATNLHSMFKNATAFNNGSPNGENGYITLLFVDGDIIKNELTTFNATNIFSTNIVSVTYTDFATDTELIKHIRDGDPSFNDANTYYGSLFNSMSFQLYTGLDQSSISISYRPINPDSNNRELVTLPFSGIETGKYITIEGDFIIDGEEKTQADIYTDNFQIMIQYRKQLDLGQFISTVKVISGEFYHLGYNSDPYVNNILFIANYNSVSNTINNLSNLFRRAFYFNQDINDWDVSNVTSMISTFNSAINYNKPLNNWNTSNVTSMNSMFRNARSFNRSINNWNVSKVTDVASMLYDTHKFTNQNTDLVIHNNEWSQFTMTSGNVIYSDDFLGYSKFVYVRDIELNNKNINKLYHNVLLNKRMKITFRVNSSILAENNMATIKLPFIYEPPIDSFGGSFNVAIYGAFNHTDNNNVIRYITINNQSINVKFIETNIGSNIFETTITVIYGNFYTLGYSNLQTNNYIVRIDNFNNYVNTIYGENRNITNLRFLFGNAIEFNQYIGDWNVKYATNMNSMFRGASSFNQDISNWNMINVENLTSMFYNSENFNNGLDNNVDGYKFILYIDGDPKNGNTLFSSTLFYNYDRYFFGTEIILQLLGDLLTNTKLISSLIENQTYTINNFYEDLIKLKSLIVTFRVPANIIDNVNMYEVSLPFSGIQDELNVSIIQDGINKNIITNTNNHTLRLTFNEITSNSNIYESTVFVNSGNFSHLGYVTPPLNNYINFIGNYSYNVNTKKITNLSYLFANNTTFNNYLNDWNVETVTAMNNMFQGTSLFNQDISNWNVGNVKTMANMFQGASSFNQDIGFWNVGKVETMANMFQGASLFNQDISNWNVENVSTMASMFQDASDFNNGTEYNSGYVKLLYKTDKINSYRTSFGLTSNKKNIDLIYSDFLTNTRLIIPITNNQTKYSNVDEYYDTLFNHLNKLIKITFNRSTGRTMFPMNGKNYEFYFDGVKYGPIGPLFKTKYGLDRQPYLSYYTSFIPGPVTIHIDENQIFSYPEWSENLNNVHPETGSLDKRNNFEPDFGVGIYKGIHVYPRELDIIKGFFGRPEIISIDNMNVFKNESLFGSLCYAYLFNQDISDWDMTNIIDASFMLFKATAFNNGLPEDENGYLSLMFKDGNITNEITTFYRTNKAVHRNEYLKWFADGTELINNIQNGFIKFNSPLAYYTKLFGSIYS